MICPTNKTTVTDFGQSTTVVNWNDLQATDNSGQQPTVTCSVESGSRFELGETEVNCQAADFRKNQAACVFTVEVKGKKPYFGVLLSMIVLDQM